MRNFIIFILGAIVGAGLLLGIGGQTFLPNILKITDLIPTYYEIKPISISQKNGNIAHFEVAIANTSEERTRGLQRIRYLLDNQGMWFIFPDEQIRTFWMKDTLIPLDILFVNSRFEIVSMVQNAPPCFLKNPNQEKCEYYSSITGAQYALELKGGMAKNEGIAIGDIVQQ